MAIRASTEARLLDAADALLFRRGVAATPVDRVLELAGASPATLYRAYGSKEGLVAAALARRHERWLAVWDEAVAEAADDRGRLLAVFEALDRFRARPDGARWCAVLGTAAEYAEAPLEIDAAVRRDTDALRARLQARAAPLVGPAAAEGLAEALLLVVSGALAMRLRDGAGGPGRAVAEVLVDAAVRDTGGASA